MPINIDSQNINSQQSATRAIRFAADKTGVDFNYLLQTAQRESALNTNAKAGTSSATGLFQFVRQTWYETLHDFGPKHGYENYAEQIKQDSSGRYYVPNQQAKIAILELRKDSKAASLMAAEFSQQNINYLKGKIGREPQAAEIYMAHFMGRGAAAKLIALEKRAPDIKADEVFPAHAKANKSIFYKNGQARSIAQVYDNLAKHHVQLATEKGLDPANIEQVSKLVPFLPGNDGFYGSLFRQQNLADGVAKPLAFSAMGRPTNAIAHPNIGTAQSNNLFLTQMSNQNTPSGAAIPLPETVQAAYGTASLSKGSNFFSLTNR
ncbi:MAG: transglycosylase SLT domain-containing protein [Rhizobiales bacterium]|nr:lytic transglycosylase domain-containing protein [Hyphomicrobiales bacterium]NRB14834.1 transglycosylase SLT domain-containing protein [Hyphomicrobiales bacterium]